MEIGYRDYIRGPYERVDILYPGIAFGYAIIIDYILFFKLMEYYILRMWDLNTTKIWAVNK